jgi:hypothetical protein
MMRTSKTGLVLVSLLALTATASAEPTGSGVNNRGGQRWAGGQYEQSKRDFYQKVTQKFHKPKPKPKPIPIDPGQGDGKPVDPPHAVPQGPPGFVWVNGHWERIKAPVPQHPAVVVRDHRKAKTSQVIVRDHRTTGGVVVRDHRVVTTGEGRQVRSQDVSSSPGGVTVSDSTAKQGVVIRDHRTR